MTRVLALFAARQRVNGWCGRRDSNPQGLAADGFSYLLRLSPPLAYRMQHPASVWGLDYPFVVLRACLEALDAARLVSTPSPSL